MKSQFLVIVFFCSFFISPAFSAGVDIDDFEHWNQLIKAHFAQLLDKKQFSIKQPATVKHKQEFSTFVYTNICPGEQTITVPTEQKSREHPKVAVFDCNQTDVSLWKKHTYPSKEYGLKWRDYGSYFLDQLQVKRLPLYKQVTKSSPRSYLEQLAYNIYISTDNRNIAYYNRFDHRIYINQFQLQELTDFEIMFSFSHEWGHHLQNIGSLTSTVAITQKRGTDPKELQADCIGGYILRHVFDIPEARFKELPRFFKKFFLLKSQEDREKEVFKGYNLQISQINQCQKGLTG
ncbi:MAG: hypothetical protein KDK51_03350 [Deltaproteobacteria bacterium]|nr:hypothetical protein [Deltaproteobacteria bacterium]